MGFITKNNPIGIDIVINDIIEPMYNELIEFGWTGYEAYHRAYKNPKSNEGLFVPEAYTGQKDGDNEYTEVFYDDTKTATSFFLTGSTTTRTNGNYTVPISIIFQLNAEELYENLGHRADEEARNDAIIAIERSVVGSRITSIVTEVKDVYAEFDTSRINFTDMSPFHVFRINLDVIVDYSCDYFCTYPAGGGFQYTFNFGLN